MAVIDPATSERELDRLQAAGVRGIRFNLVSPAGRRGDPAADTARARAAAEGPRLARAVDVQASQLPRLAACRPDRACFVLDPHLAGLHARLPEHAPAWVAAQALADGGAWVKLSGWYRLGTAAPYDALGRRSGAWRACSAPASCGGRTGRTPAFPPTGCRTTTRPCFPYALPWARR